ncbi:MAG: hypothetical protein ACMXYF_03855 [Candidatus Woesearchaeota archaeon]
MSQSTKLGKPFLAKLFWHVGLDILFICSFVFVYLFFFHQTLTEYLFVFFQNVELYASQIDSETMMPIGDLPSLSLLPIFLQLFYMSLIAFALHAVVDMIKFSQFQNPPYIWYLLVQYGLFIGFFVSLLFLSPLMISGDAAQYALFILAVLLWTAYMAINTYWKAFLFKKKVRYPWLLLISLLFLWSLSITVFFWQILAVFFVSVCYNALQIVTFKK